MMKRSNYNWKTLGCCLLAITGVVQSNAQHVSLAWTKQFNSDKLLSSGAGITTDAAGNVYVAGAFGGTVDFDPGPKVYNLTADGETDVFVSKSDADGNFIWAKKMGGPLQSDRARAIAVDKKGNVYTTGIFHGTANFDPNNNNNGWLTANGLAWADVFISKLDSAGNFVWAKSVGGAGHDDPVSIAIDDNDNVFVYGAFDEKADFDPGTGTSYLTPQTLSHFLLKLNNDGNFEWAKMIGGDAMMFLAGMTLAPSGNIYISASFMMGGYVDFDPGPDSFKVSAIGVLDFCTIKLDKQGAFVWAKQISSNNYGVAFPVDISTDSKENVITAGAYSGTFDFNPSAVDFSLSTTTTSDVFISKLDSAGNFIWATSTAGSGASAVECYSIALDKMDNVYTTGTFRKSVDFAPSTATDVLTSHGTVDINNDAFLYKLNSDGSYAWAKQLGGNDVTMGYGIDVDASGNVFSTGYFTETCDFDPGTGKYDLVANATNPAIYTHKMICADTNSSIIDVTAECYGYLFGDKTYKEDGVYSRVVTNKHGCDSIITLNLTINQLKATIAVDSFVLKTVEHYTSYQWLVNGKVIDGATDSTYQVQENGGYQVVVINERGCTDTSEVYNINNVGVKDMARLATQVRIYPNPTTDLIYVQAPLTVNLTLTDITGKRLKQANQSRNISIKDYASGMYLLEITDMDGNSIKTEKIVKKN